mgnify:CR=1 FL=1
MDISSFSLHFDSLEGKMLIAMPTIGDDLGAATWFHGTAIRSEPPAWRAESELAKLRRHAEQLDADTNV